MHRIALATLLIATLARAEDAAIIDLSGFADGIHHWQMNQGRGRNDPRYGPHEIVAIGDNILRYQNADGGWPKNMDYLLKLPREVVAPLRGPAIDKSTFDNRSTYTQVAYLAELFTRTGEKRFRDGAVKGLNYILAEQRPSGGWRGADVDAITFNDDVMTGIMHLLLDIREGNDHYAWLDTALRKRCDTALIWAIACTLKCQITVEGVKTGWCQQHDHESYAPVKARSYELASLCPAETTQVCRVLMRLADPDAAVVAAIDAAVAWMDAVKIEGIRIERPAIDPVAFENHTATNDVVVVNDPNAPPLWTRYYEIGTNRPFFCNRDGTVVYTLAEVHLERRSGYGWYGSWPASLIANGYPSWKDGLND